MRTARVIARLDIKGPNLVKGIHLEGLRVLGDPASFASYYYETGADELMYMDVVASLYERNSLTHIVSRTAKDIFVPLTVGGGIRTIDDINTALRAGADKVCLNTAALKDPRLIERAAIQFGSSTIVIAIEAIRQPNGSYLAYTDNGREHTGVDAVEWAERVEKLGAGEIVATSVDKEGTGKGFDLEFTKTISDMVSIPVIAHGGAGNTDHIVQVFEDGQADAVAIASILHYDCMRQLSSHTGQSSKEGNFEFINSGRAIAGFAPVGIPEVKRALGLRKVHCRP